MNLKNVSNITISTGFLMQRRVEIKYIHIYENTHDTHLFHKLNDCNFAKRLMSWLM